MKAVRFSRFGGPEVLDIVDLPDPHPGPGQIRIAVRAAGINPSDWKKRQGLMDQELPQTLGHEAAGIVDELGDGVPALQAVCDRFGPAHIQALLRKWLAILPNPFTPADEAAGYRYELSIPQAEFSLTQMLDRPTSGRIFFEQVLHDNLDAGRPDQISLASRLTTMPTEGVDSSP